MFDSYSAYALRRIISSLFLIFLVGTQPSCSNIVTISPTNSAAITDSNSGVWTPADIANLEIFLHFKAGHVYQDAAGTIPATVGTPVNYVAPLFGTTNAATGDEINDPTLQSDGLQLDAGGVDKLLLTSPVLGNGAFTVYWSFIQATGAVSAFLSHSTLATLLGGLGDVAIYDTNTNAANTSIVPDAVTLGRFSTDALNGNFHMISTNETAFAGANSFQAFSYDQIGGTGFVGAGNDSINNRYRLIIWINRNISYLSAEDLKIREWIATNDGATLD